MYGANASGGLVHIADSESGAGNLVCPDCGGALIGRKGSIRVHHFSHASGSDCTHAGETALHRIAKEVIASGRELLLPASEVAGLDGTEVLRSETPVQFDAVDIETWENGIRPDLIGTVRFSKNGIPQERRLVIEILVTHKVGAKKLGLLKERGESVLEIDLSKVERGLDGEAFTSMVLEEAPRQWLYHRDIERREAELKQARLAQDRERERRKTYAISMAEREARQRDAASLTSPCRATSEDLSWAEDEWARWTIVQHRDFLLVQAKDGMFDVPPKVWRAAVLQILAPWNESQSKLPFRPEIKRISEETGKGFRKKGWVKGPFSGKLTQFRSGRRQTWDPVGEEITAFLERGLVALQYTKSFSFDQGDIEAAKSGIAAKWKRVQSNISSIVRLSRALEEQALELRFKGNPVSTKEEVEIVLLEYDGLTNGDATSWRTDVPFHWLMGGRSLTDLSKTVENLTSFGYEFVSLCDGKNLTAEAVVDVLGSGKIKRWKEELSDWTRAETEAIHSEFLSLIDRSPVIRSSLGAEGFECLLSVKGVEEAIGHPLELDGKDPLLAAKSEAEKAAKSLRSIAWELGQALALADTVEDRGLAEFIQIQGITIGLQHATGRVRQNLRGLHGEDDFQAAIRMLRELEGISARRGYGKEFPRRALDAKLPGVKARLLEMVFGGYKTEYRKAMSDIRIRREPPGWVL